MSDTRIRVEQIRSDGAGAGDVATADGSGGVSFEAPTSGGQYRVLTYVLDGMGGFEFVVDGTGAPVTALADLE